MKQVAAELGKAQITQPKLCLVTNYKMLENKNYTPTGASTNPRNFDLNKNLDMNLI